MKAADIQTLTFFMSTARCSIYHKYAEGAAGAQQHGAAEAGGTPLDRVPGGGLGGGGSCLRLPHPPLALLPAALLPGLHRGRHHAWHVVRLVYPDLMCFVQTWRPATEAGTMPGMWYMLEHMHLTLGTLFQRLVTDPTPTQDGHARVRCLVGPGHHLWALGFGV